MEDILIYNHKKQTVDNETRISWLLTFMDVSQNECLANGEELCIKVTTKKKTRTQICQNDNQDRDIGRRNSKYESLPTTWL